MRYHGANQISAFHFVRLWLNNEVKLDQVIEKVGIIRAPICMNYIKKKYYEQYKQEVGISKEQSFFYKGIAQAKLNYRHTFFSYEEIVKYDVRLVDTAFKPTSMRKKSKALGYTYFCDKTGRYWHEQIIAKMKQRYPNPDVALMLHTKSWFLALDITDLNAYLSTLPAPTLMQKPVSVLNPEAPAFVPDPSNKHLRTCIQFNKMLSDIPANALLTKQISQHVRGWGDRSSLLRADEKKRLYSSFISAGFEVFS